MPGVTTSRTDAPALRLEITGMTCEHCQGHVEAALRAVPGVATANVDLEAGTASVLFANPGVAPSVLCGAVGDAGYDARVLPEPDPDH
jgi:copper chaperone CopZ